MSSTSNNSGSERPVTPNDDNDYEHVEYTPIASPGTPRHMLMQMPVPEDAVSEAETVVSAAETDISNAETVDVEEGMSSSDSFVDLGSIAQQMIEAEGSDEDEPDEAEVFFGRRGPVQQLPGLADYATDDESEQTNGNGTAPGLFEKLVESAAKDNVSVGADSQMTVTPSSMAETATKPASSVLPMSGKSQKGSRIAVMSMGTIVGLLALAWLTFQTAMTMGWSGASLNAGAELAIRREALGQVMSHVSNHSSIHKAISIDNVLHYPQATITVNGTPMPTVGFPATLHVEVVKPDQLFVSFPKLPGKDRYPSKVHIGVYKDGEVLTNINRTHLLDGVFHVSIDPNKAYGYVNVAVLTVSRPAFNDTVKVDLGSRLLQTRTYQSAAVRVQDAIHSEAVSAHGVFKRLELGALSGVVAGFDCASRVANYTITKHHEAAEAAKRIVEKGINHTVRSNVLLSKTVEKASVNAKELALSDLAKIEKTAAHLVAYVKGAMPAKRSFKADVKKARANAKAIRNRFVHGKKLALPKLGRVNTIQSRLVESRSAIQGLWKRIWPCDRGTIDKNMESTKRPSSLMPLPKPAKAGVKAADRKSPKTDVAGTMGKVGKNTPKKRETKSGSNGRLR